MKFVLNPGDYFDVHTFSDRVDALSAYRDSYNGRLYACFRWGSTSKFVWDEYTPEHGWNTVNRDNLPVKVLWAGER